jgi:acetyltransferase-like isoleucine patch superfamily enzyme
MFGTGEVIADIFRRLLGGRQYSMEPGAVIHQSARIFNKTGTKSAIHIGRFTHVRGELLTFAHGGTIRIGEYCYIGESSRIWSARRILIGNRVLIAHNVTILDSLTHPIGAKARHEHFKHIITEGHPDRIDLGERAVDIGDDVWIGCMSIVLRGVSLGHGAIVGAGSVVTENVPAWTLVAGNPARIIRELEGDER